MNDLKSVKRQVTKFLPDCRRSEEATKSNDWKCRGSTQLVSDWQASTKHCKFCNDFAQFYFPHSKLIKAPIGHLVPLQNNDLNVQFYSPTDTCSSTKTHPHVQKFDTGDIDITHFDYTYDSNNLRSQQEIPRDPNLYSREFLLREGIPESILKHCDSDFNRIRLNSSIVQFIFNNTNSIRFRLYRQLRDTKSLRDVFYWQFSSIIKDFINLHVKTYSISLLNYCIDNNIIPKKFRKHINIDNRHRTKLIRKDCCTMSKHLMQQTIADTQKELDVLYAKFGGYVWMKCCNIQPYYRTLIYHFLIKIRNICAFVCSLKHNHKIHILTQNTPHICVNLSNIIDVALKTSDAKVESCKVQHHPHFYWRYREYTIEYFHDQLKPDWNHDGGEQNLNIEPQTKVWEHYLARVTKSKSLISDRNRMMGDFKDHWNKFLYGFRWGENLSTNTISSDCNLAVIDQSNYIPWQKPSVSLPARSSAEAEINKELLNVWEGFDIDTSDEKLTQEILLDFLNDNNFRVVSSDKTNRCLLIKNDDYIQQGEKFLSDNKDYLLLARDPNKLILDKSNSIINAIKKTNHTFRRGDLDKLIKYTPAPAKLSFVIKDHKTKNTVGHYPP